MKKIGIVVPIYNKQPYLRKCIESIINQTYENISIVLVNDGSIDDSGLICDEYAKKDKRISVIHQKNRGRVFSRYIGLKHLECDYATFIDADDWINRDTYEKLSQYIENDIEMIIYQAISYYDETDQRVMPCYYDCGYYDKKRIEEKIFPNMIWDIKKQGYGLIPSLCNKLVKREIIFKELEQAQNLDILYGDDSAITWSMMLNIKSLQITSHLDYFYRQRPIGVIAPQVSDKNFYKNLLKHYEYLMEKMRDNQILVKQLDYHFAGASNIHLRLYGDKSAKNNDFIFPFDKVSVNKKMILYGAGTVGQTYYHQLKKINYANEIIWIDKNFEVYKDLGVLGVDVINQTMEYDYVVIAILDKNTVETVKIDLINRGVEESKIVW